jgi:hypothetical protein
MLFIARFEGACSVVLDAKDAEDASTRAREETGSYPSEVRELPARLFVAEFDADELVLCPYEGEFVDWLEGFEAEPPPPSGSLTAIDEACYPDDPSEP